MATKQNVIDALQALGWKQVDKIYWPAEDDPILDSPKLEGHMYPEAFTIVMGSPIRLRHGAWGEGPIQSGGGRFTWYENTGQSITTVLEQYGTSAEQWTAALATASKSGSGSGSGGENENKYDFAQIAALLGVTVKQAELMIGILGITVVLLLIAKKQGRTHRRPYGRRQSYF